MWFIIQIVFRYCFHFQTCWQRSSTLPGDMTVSGNGSTLIIESSTLSDVGTYTCVASNIQGVANHSTLLRVQGKRFANLYICNMFFCLKKIQTYIRSSSKLKIQQSINSYKLNDRFSLWLGYSTLPISWYSKTLSF